MYLCAIANQTHAFLNPNIEKILEIKNNEVIGSIGRIFDDLLIRKNLRKCTLIGDENLGEKLENRTFTGNLGLIQSGRAVVYLKSEAPILDEPFINYGIPFYREKFMITMEIGDETSQKEVYNLLNNLNLGLWLSIAFFAAIFLSVLISIIIQISSDLVVDKRRVRRFRTTTIQKFFKDHLTSNFTPSALGFFMIFYFLYLWFVRLTLGNNIKTNKVVVDLSLLIRTREDALRTDRTFCLFEGNTELQIARLGGKENILTQLHEEKGMLKKPIINLDNKVKRDRCIVEKIVENSNIDFSELYTIMSESTFYALSSVLTSVRQGLVIWFYSKPIFEMNFHIIIRNKKELVDHFNKMLLFYTESGIPHRMVNLFHASGYAFFYKNKVYKTTEEYLDDNSKFDQLSFGNFEKIFMLYFIFCLSVLIIFLIDHCVYRKIIIRKCSSDSEVANQDFSLVDKLKVNFRLNRLKAKFKKSSKVSPLDHESSEETLETTSID